MSWWVRYGKVYSYVFKILVFGILVFGFGGYWL